MTERTIWEEVERCDQDAADAITIRRDVDEWYSHRVEALHILINALYSRNIPFPPQSESEETLSPGNKRIYLD